MQTVMLQPNPTKILMIISFDCLDPRHDHIKASFYVNEFRSYYGINLVFELLLVTNDKKSLLYKQRIFPVWKTIVGSLSRFMGKNSFRDGIS